MSDRQTMAEIVHEDRREADRMERIAEERNKLRCQLDAECLAGPDHDGPCDVDPYL